MWNKLALVATVATTVVGAAYAQQPSTISPAPSVPPAVTTPTPVSPSRAAVPSSAPDQVLTNLPANATTVTNYYKQNVYDPSENKIGEISDVLVTKEGRIDALIVSVGGFLGIGEKDVAVPFTAVRGEERNGKWYLTMNATKDALKNAPGYKYDRNRATWVPA